MRTFSREKRASETARLDFSQQQIRQQSQQLQTAGTELQRIRNLPTRQQVQQQARSQVRSDLKLARVAIRDKSIAIASLPKNIRSVVQKIRAGQSDSAIIKRAEESLGQSLSAVDRQTVLDLAKGITFEEISAKQSLISSPFTTADLPKVTDFAKVDVRTTPISLKEIGGTLLTPFKTTLDVAFPKDDLTRQQIEKNVKTFVTKIQERGDRTNTRLDIVKTNIEEFLDPTQREARLASDRAFNRLDIQRNELNRKVESFNKKFGDKDLNKTQQKNAEKEAQAIANLEAFLSQRERELTRQFAEAKKVKEGTPLSLFTEALKGIATSPFSLIQFGISATTRPVKTTEEAIEGAKDLPSAVGKSPFAVSGAIIGEAIGLTILTSAVLGSLKGITSTKNLQGSGNRFVFEKPPKGGKTSLQKAFPEEINFKINDNQVKIYLQNELRKRGGNFNKLGEIEQDFLIGQIRARIRNQPELFIPEIRKLALKKAGVKDLRKFTRARLEGEFEPLILREQLRRGDLTDLQKRTLQRVAENLERKRISKAIETKPTEIRRSQLLTEIEREFILKQFEAQIRARKLDLTPSQRNLLNQVKTKQEFARIRKAILEGKKPISPSEFLTEFERSNITSQILAQIRANPELTLSPAQRIALRRVKTKSEMLRVRKAIEKGSDKLLPSELIPKDVRTAFEKRLGVQARAKEFQRFEQRQQVLVQKPILEIKTTQLTQLQRNLLKRLRESKTANARAIQEVRRQRQVAVPKPEALRVLQKSQQQQKLVQKQLAVEGRRLKQQQSSQQAFVKTQQTQLKRLQAKQKSITLLASPERSAVTNQIQLQRQAISQAQASAQRSGQQLQNFMQSFAQLQNVGQPQRFAQRVAERTPLRTKQQLARAKLRGRRFFFLPRGLLMERPKQKRDRTTQGYNAFGKSKGKLLKLNRKPLTKARAKDTMAWFVDNSLSASGAIKKTSGKPKISRLGIPFNYGKNTSGKFREFKIRKGQPIATPNKFIEFRSKRIDTQGEKRNIKLARLLAQKRKAIGKRIPPPKFKRV